MSWRRGQAYSQDIRDRVIALAGDGMKVGEVAEQLLLSISYVSKVLSRLRLTGETSARPQRCHLPLRLAPLHEAIAAEVAARPDATLDELRQWLLATHAVTASKGLMVKTLAQLDLTHKKSPSARPNRTARMLPQRAARGGIGSGR
jgi:transposase